MLAQRDLLKKLTRTKAYKNDFQLLPKELDATVKLHFLTLGAELSAMAGALDAEELSSIELLECGTTPAGALDHEELLDVELLECGTTPAGALDHEELLHVELEMWLLEVEVASPSC